jgi:tellurite resistance protein TehA-like permease
MAATALSQRAGHAVRTLTPGYFALVMGTGIISVGLHPPLPAAGIWRHFVHRVPLACEATLWSIVFPLGMYAVAGIYLGRADRLPIVGAIGKAELWVALVVWIVVFVAMLGNLWRTVARAEAAQ